MKKMLFFLMFFLFLGSLGLAMTCRPPDLPPHPTAEQIMQHWFDIKFTRFVNDAVYNGVNLIMIDKSGYKREKKAVRKRIIMHGKNGFDYKDLIAITYPEYSKGLAVLNWAYMDVNKQNDIWIWLPSMKKIRKVSQAEGDDSFMGTEFTVEEVTTRRYGYETYELLGEEIFKGYKAHYNKKIYYANTPCYKIKAVPKKNPWYYTYRIVWIDKNTGIDVYEEYYDKRGRKFKEIFHYFDTPKEGCWWARMWEVYNFRTGHSDTLLIEPGRYNSGLKERHFSPRILERQEW